MSAYDDVVSGKAIPAIDNLGYVDPNGEKHKIVAVRRLNGVTTAVKLDDGQELTVAQAVNLCENGLLPGFNVGYSKFGEAYLRGIGDGDQSNNLDNLPTF